MKTEQTLDIASSILMRKYKWLFTHTIVGAEGQILPQQNFRLLLRLD